MITDERLEELKTAMLAISAIAQERKPISTQEMIERDTKEILAIINAEEQRRKEKVEVEE